MLVSKGSHQNTPQALHFEGKVQKPKQPTHTKLPLLCRSHKSKSNKAKTNTKPKQPTDRVSFASACIMQCMTCSNISFGSSCAAFNINPVFNNRALKSILPSNQVFIVQQQAMANISKLKTFKCCCSSEYCIVDVQNSIYSVQQAGVLLTAWYSAHLL